MIPNFNDRFDAAYSAWLEKRYYLEAKPGFCWQAGKLVPDPRDPADLGTPDEPVDNSPVTDFEVF